MLDTMLLISMLRVWIFNVAPADIERCFANEGPRENINIHGKSDNDWFYSKEAPSRYDVITLWDI